MIMLTFYGAVQYAYAKSEVIDINNDDLNERKIVNTNNDNGMCVSYFKICNLSIACLHYHLFFVFTKQNY